MNLRTTMDDFHPAKWTLCLYFAVLTDILFWWFMGEDGWVFGRGEWGKVWCFLENAPILGQKN